MDSKFKILKENFKLSYSLKKKIKLQFNIENIFKKNK